MNRCCKKENSTIRLDGKTVIITGSNTGIGKEAARDLAHRGARVILACRNVKKANEAAEEIKSQTENKEIIVIVKQLDLASLTSVRQFADDIITTEQQVNILINNAGIVTQKAKTVDGYDMTFQTNHLGHFLLTNLLLPKLKESAPARIINLTSSLYRLGVMAWDDLNMDSPGSYDSVAAYNQSKLASIYFTRELAHRLKDEGVTAYVVDPGYAETEGSSEMRNNFNVLLRPFMYVMLKLFSTTAADGAKTTIYCAITPEIASHSGRYYKDCKESQLKAIGRDEVAPKRLWEISAEMVKLED